MKAHRHSSAGATSLRVEHRSDEGRVHFRQLGDFSGRATNPLCDAMSGTDLAHAATSFIHNVTSG
eukprot:2305893-Rhodomonas_salina.2